MGRPTHPEPPSSFSLHGVSLKPLLLSGTLVPELISIAGLIKPPKMSDSEKPTETIITGAGETQDDLHEHNEKEGYIVDTEGGTQGKVAEDGHTVLIPQSSDDPNDPLNWSWNKKHLILFVVSLAAFLPDYGSATGAVTLLGQAE
jgi:hypothetical protein